MAVYRAAKTDVPRRARRAVACVLCLAMVLSILCGCAAERVYPPALTLSDQTPPSQVGGLRSGRFDAELFFTSSDGRRLYAETRRVYYGGAVSRAYAALEALFTGPSEATLGRSVPEGLELERVEVSMHVCNVYLGGTFPEYETDWLTARAAIAATAAAAEGVEAVNVYFDNIDPGYQNHAYALGEMAPLSETLETYLKNMEQTYPALPEETEQEQTGGAGTYETHTATLYFTNTDRTLLAAQSTEMLYPTGCGWAEVAQMLVDRLRVGDAGGDNLEPVLPSDFALLSVQAVKRYGELTGEGTAQSAPQASVPAVSGSDEYVIELLIREPAEAYDETLMCAALTLTLTGFIPNARGVRIFVQNDAGESRLLKGDSFKRDEFTEFVGHRITLYYPDADGLTLHAVSRIVQNEAIYDAQARLGELLSGAADPGVPYALFTIDDIEEVYVMDGVAVINWRVGFLEKLAAYLADEQSTLDAGRRETMFLYGVVNTLTELPMVSGVWMLENGEKLGMAQNIYLGSALVRNPGLIAER